MQETNLNLQKNNLSVLQQTWSMRKQDESKINEIRQQYGLSDFIARILAGRDFKQDEIQNFLNPKIKNLLPDPAIFNDMQKASTRILNAINKNESIAILADYDVDGATSSALLCDYLSQLNVTARRYIPERLTEGYGPNQSAINTLKDEGHNIIITLDCGTSSPEILAKAQTDGIDIIVIDHHVPQENIPQIFALINPNCSPENHKTQPYGSLAAVGMAFLFTVSINRELRQNGFFKNHKEPELTNLLDLVALGTVCDVMPLQGLNRAYVVQGLKILNQRKRQGLKALCQVSQITNEIGVYDLGFNLGPRLNAASRLGQSRLASDLLLCQDNKTANQTANQLNSMNLHRRQLEAQCLDEAINHAQTKLENTPNPYHIIANGEGWHAGIVGILAARLKDNFQLPAIVITFEGDIGKGSGRSVAGVDLGSAIIAATQKGLLINGGGHAQAVGLRIHHETLTEFDAFLNQHIAKQLQGEPLPRQLKIDAHLGLSGANTDLLEELKILEPFGKGNSRPVKLFRNLHIVRPKIISERHISCLLCDSSNTFIRAIAFGCINNALGGALLNSNGNQEFHIAGYIQAPFRASGKTAEIVIKDAMPA